MCFDCYCLEAFRGILCMHIWHVPVLCGSRYRKNLNPVSTRTLCTSVEKISCVQLISDFAIK